ncbi:hypothetical protein MS3_00010346 [Schistosoma haematobium]|uniref:Uncharacterized protein n=1 Tax=Schistosoma haematobium TaxID=6185 RepID=A0A922LNY6_SCHHA|nr:hypothetical protein MS3_00010346 [Schistosoma haematobium]KAH9590626.1 hypothetical protein MS3_00010346 [Schistosoma haematobium]
MQVVSLNQSPNNSRCYLGVKFLSTNLGGGTPTNSMYIFVICERFKIKPETVKRLNNHHIRQIIIIRFTVLKLCSLYWLQSLKFTATFWLGLV